MKVSLLARLILWSFVAVFAFAAAYLLLDTFGIWQGIPTSLTHGLEVLTGLILLLALAGHLALATGALPAAPEADRRR